MGKNNMRETDIININKKDLKFTALYYLDGPKLEVNTLEKSIIVWYDENDIYEEWFYIKCDALEFDKYISNDISLRKIIKNNIVYMAKRYYQEYDCLKEINRIEDLNSIDDLPEVDSYLGFNYYYEINPLKYITSASVSITFTKVEIMQQTLKRDKSDFSGYKSTSNTSRSFDYAA